MAFSKVLYTDTMKTFVDKVNELINGVEEIIAKSPFDFTIPGLKGDGSSDDTQALQDAIDRLEDGGVIHLPPGTYNISEIRLRPGVAIKGAGKSTTIFRHTGQGKAFYNIDPSKPIEGFIISDLTLELNPQTHIGIDFTNTHSSIISEVDIIGGSSNTTAILLSSSTNILLEGILVRGSEGSAFGLGFSFVNGSSHIKLINCQTDNVDNPINIASDYVLLLGCYLQNVTTGIVISGNWCQVLFPYLVNTSGYPSGIGIQINPGAANNTIIGNAMINILNPIVNNSTEPNMIWYTGVNGQGSGVDADLLRGYQPTEAGGTQPNSIAVTNSSGRVGDSEKVGGYGPTTPGGTQPNKVAVTDGSGKVGAAKTADTADKLGDLKQDDLDCMIWMEV